MHIVTIRIKNPANFILTATVSLQKLKVSYRGILRSSNKLVDKQSKKIRFSESQDKSTGLHPRFSVIVRLCI